MPGRSQLVVAYCGVVECKVDSSYFPGLEVAPGGSVTGH